MKKTDEQFLDEQLLDQVSALRIRNAELEALQIRHNQMEKKLTQQTHDLKERIKEINCLYNISKIVEKADISLNEIYQAVIEVIPCSWQYPEITCAQLIINGKQFVTENYMEVPWKQSADIILYGETVGVLSVCYREQKPELYEGPFLKEERSLINAIAERLGRTSEQKQAEKALYESEKKLKKQNQLLKDKNIALREVMNQMISEKKNLEERVLDNIDELLLPLLKKLQNKGSDIEDEYFKVFEDNLKQLTSSFGSSISRKIPRLTPRENEICNMIRSGLSSKEVAKLLNISYRSVETYRNYIRKKLGITNQKINLSTYLATL
ncbi:MULTISPECIES: helix-turn-helix transcriptional regulator [Desulfobacula]|uniref:Transcriptional regulator, LuxR family n=2 Tax=Desulfobacula TaxID=28222 RepID=K0NNG5_DESTT|nr:MULTISPECIES: helix-turn-helix transcriptional regulator [Desulfobacula]CCK82195.1 transcriptional regulator, LuxR family [Desulfobacula toluolica Tol2]